MTNFSFMRDPQVSSVILAVAEKTEVTERRKKVLRMCKKDSECKTIEKELIAKSCTRCKVINGSNCKTSVRYFRNTTEISDNEFVIMFPKQCNRFKEMFQKHFNELTKKD